LDIALLFAEINDQRLPADLRDNLMSATKNQQFTNVSRIDIRVLSLQKSATVQGWRAAGRALISGYVDSYTLSNFGVYASFMSGNTTSAGVHAGHAKFALAGHSLLPFPFFVLGIFIGTHLVLANRHRELPRHSFLVAALLTFDIAAIYFGWPGWLSITVLSTAMGLMNTSITHVGGQAVNLGFVTGDLNNFAQRLAMGIRRDPLPQMQGSWDNHWWRAALLAGIWTAFLIGAVLGAALASRFAMWALLLPVVMLFVFGLLECAAI
jgi:uncharacterized membrane protein YoaK (UPF0700 family)